LRKALRRKNGKKSRSISKIFSADEPHSNSVEAKHSVLAYLPCSPAALLDKLNERKRKYLE